MRSVSFEDGIARPSRDDYLGGDHDFLAPALLRFEAINGPRYSGYYDDDRLAAAAGSLSTSGIDLRPFADPGAVTRAAEALAVAVYDASYVALAAAADGRAYTANESLLSAVEGPEWGDRLARVGENR